MKKYDHEYLKKWLITSAIAMIAGYFGCSVTVILGKIFFATNDYYFNLPPYILGYIINTAWISIMFYKIFYSYSFAANKNVECVEMKKPIIDQCIGIGITLLIPVIARGKYYFCPTVSTLAMAICYRGYVSMIPPPMSFLIPFQLLQSLIYAGSAMTAYVLARKKQDQNEYLRILRKEHAEEERHKSTHQSAKHAATKYDWY